MPPAAALPQLYSYVEGLEFARVRGETLSLSHRGVRFYPLRQKAAQEPGELLLLEEALDRRALVVHETDVVARLEVESRSALPILILEGEIVLGGRQNRAFNTTFVLQPGCRRRVPVTCVEEGRWDGSQEYKAAPCPAPPSLKSGLKHSVTTSIELSLGSSRESDQSRAWGSVSKILEESQVHDPHQDLSAAYAERREELHQEAQTIARRLRRARGVGLLVLFPGGRSTLEAFGNEAIAARAVERLVRSHLLAAGDPRQRLHPPLDPLGQLLRARETCVPGLGKVGQEVRLRKGALNGSAFLLEGALLHLSADWSLGEEGRAAPPAEPRGPSRQQRVGEDLWNSLMNTDGDS